METKRLTLRELTPEDFPAFAELIRDKMRSEISRYDNQFPTDDEGLRKALNYMIELDCFFAVVLKGAEKLIGFVSLNKIDAETRNFGYFVHSGYQGNGYAAEAAAPVVAYARDTLKTRKLRASTAEVNTPSVRLLKRAGFVCTGKGNSSFAKDEHGDPIVFKSLSFELIL